MNRSSTTVACVTIALALAPGMAQAAPTVTVNVGGTNYDVTYLGTPEKANCSLNAKAANERRDSRCHAWLSSDQRISHFKLPHGPEYLQEGIRPLPGIEPSTDGDKKEAEKPQDLLCAHHDKCH